MSCKLNFNFLIHHSAPKTVRIVQKIKILEIIDPLVNAKR